MKKLLLLLIAFTVFASCQKEETKPTEESQNYMPLDIGNYWIYQHFKVDSLGNETAYEVIDSVVISRDTSISGKTYSILENYWLKQPVNLPSKSMLRDSSGYLVNEKGRISFAKNNFTDVLYSYVYFQENDTAYTAEYKMEVPDHLITVPAGTFNALNYKGNHHYYNHNSDNTEIIQVYSDTFYAPNIGMILKTGNGYSSKKTTFEKRLIRYNVSVQNVSED